MTHFVSALARWMALLGGLVLIALIVLTTVSVIGRSLNSLGHSAAVAQLLPQVAVWLTAFGPIIGDVELVESGVAFAIMAFFPWCLHQRGHATVDVFTLKLPPRIVHSISLLWDSLFAFVMGVITHRLYVGTTNKRDYSETSFMLEYPIWWGFAAVTVAAGVATFIALWMVFVRIDDLRKGTAL